MNSQTLVLASQSPYRKALLDNAGYDFEVRSTDFDEEAFKSSHSNLSPAELCLEMARGKALQARDLPELSYVIGSDQLIELDGEIFGKPGSHRAACAQLQKLSGKTHWLHTSLALVNPSLDVFLKITTTEVTLRDLAPNEIESYLKLDEPYGCAGSYMMEKAGLFLCEKISGPDPSAIQGLSLIGVSSGLRHFDISPTSFWRKTK